MKKSALLLACLIALLFAGKADAQYRTSVQVAGVTAATGTGVADSSVLRVVLASDNTLAVTGSFWQATQPVSGTFWQSIQPVSGSVSVSNFPATQPVSGSVSVSNFPATQPVSIAVEVAVDASGHTIPVAQSGAWVITSITNPVAVTGAFYQATQPVSIASMPSTPVTGSFWQSTQPISVASLPQQMVAQNEARATYYCDTGTYTTASSPTDIFTLQGSGTKTIRIVAVYAVTAATLPSIIRRSSADTNGTSASLTISQFDSGDSAATAAAKKYTVNPSGLGTTAITAVNQIAAASAVTPLWQMLNWQKPIYLRGTAEYLVLNGGPSAGSVRFVVIWTEE